jgi:hypothetical protein
MSCRSISSRSGGLSSWTGTVPVRAHPVVDGGLAGLVTTAVGTDVAVSEPSAFEAVTRTLRVFSRSTALSRYSLVVAPLIEEQLPPF